MNITRRDKEKWDWHMGFICAQDPFVHNLLLIMSKRPTDHIATMGVTVEDSGQIILYFNPKFFNILPEKQVRFVICHEIYHVALHHTTTRKPLDCMEHELHNIAADLAINSLLTSSSNHYREMPTGKFKGVLPKDYGFPEKLALEDYLELLKKDMKENPQNYCGLNQDGNGEQGEGGGEGSDDSSDDGDKKGKGKAGSKNENYGDGKRGSFDSHGGWQPNSYAKEKIKAKIERMAKSDKAWGDMPADIKMIIMAAQKSKVDWTKQLRSYLGMTLSPEMDPTMKRPNRRFGWPFPGKTPQYMSKGLAAIDASASMVAKQLSQCVAEINAIRQYYPIDMAMFDADIELGPIPWDSKKVKFEGKGGGGTSFQPVVELAEKKRYSTLIILTDGMAPAPKKPRFVKDIIWVLIDHREAPVPWGRKVCIESPAYSKY
jgi:predicted metal-dependent peptidase